MTLALSLKQQLARIEKNYPEDFYPIESCSRLHRRSIFVCYDGSVFLINSEGGVDHFGSIQQATTHITTRPERYPVSGSRELPGQS